MLRKAAQIATLVMLGLSGWTDAEQPAAVPAAQAGAGRALVGFRGEVDKLVKPLFDEQQAVGIVVGVISGEQREVFAYGTVASESEQVPDGDTIFEIGSITKTFTALVLADMVCEGVLGLDDPVRLCLPDDMTMPTRGGRDITLLHLATHTSGLPRLPGGLLAWAAVSDNPYRAYNRHVLAYFLANHELRRDIGAEWEYSNLGRGASGLRVVTPGEAAVRGPDRPPDL